VIAFVALAWGRLTPAGIDSMKMKGRMNKELPITYLARYEEAAWSPTGQPYWAQPSTEESEQLARRVGSGLRRDDSHQVDASGTMPSTKRKKQNSRTRSI